MAKPGLAQDQTVEEILASIRQVINGDQSRPAPAAARPAGVAMPPTRGRAAAAEPTVGGTVTPIHGGKIAPTADAEGEDAEADAASADVDTETAEERPAGKRAEVQDVIELAIEQALDRVDPDEMRAETADLASADAAPQAQARAEPPVANEPEEAVEPQTVHEMPRMAQPQPAREARHAEPQVAWQAPAGAAPRPSREAPGAAEAPREMPRTIASAPRPTAPPAAHGLLSPRANAAVSASFDDLARVLAHRDARDIDEMVEDLLRPMLKSWLEDNLPSLVERLVREEIERVSRGGR